MTVGLEVGLEHRSIERIEGDLLVAGFFREDRPLKGVAGRVDWRLCGLVSKMLLDGAFSGKQGEAILVPTQGRLRIARVLLVGLGETGGFGAAGVRERTQEATERALQLGASRVVLEPLGIRAEEFPAHAASLLGAVLKPLREREATLRLDLLVPEAEQGRVDAALRKAITTKAAGEATLLGRRARQPLVADPEGLSQAL